MNEATLKISEGMQDLAGALDDVIEEIAGERVAFALIIFTEGRASYISSAKREEVRQQMLDLIKFWDEGMPDIPAHEYKG
jgi:hypothetical protein